jgi:prevent-host-death family protein
VVAVEEISVGVREAKAKLSKLLRYARAGKAVIITERGIPTARIVPIEKEALSLRERLLEMERQGLVSPLSCKPRLPKPVMVPGTSAQRILREDRNKW